MKVRVKGTDGPFREVLFVDFGDGSFPVSMVEEEGSEDMEWKNVRNAAAVSVMPKCVETVEMVLLKGGSITEKTMAAQVAFLALQYADALVNKLKTERNGNE